MCQGPVAVLVLAIKRAATVDGTILKNLKTVIVLMHQFLIGDLIEFQVFTITANVCHTSA
jgi:hypothetical protein